MPKTVSSDSEYATLWTIRCIIVSQMVTIIYSISTEVLASEDLDGFPGVLRPGSRRTFYVFGQIGGTQGFSIFYDK